MEIKCNNYLKLYSFVNKMCEQIVYLNSHVFYNLKNIISRLKYLFQCNGLVYFSKMELI